MTHLMKYDSCIYARISHTTIQIYFAISITFSKN